MIYSKAFEKKFFHKGTDNQKRADIGISFRRPGTKEMQKWSDNEKTSAKDFVAQCIKDAQSWAKIFDEL